MIVRATISDVKRLTALAIESKSYWGYSNDVLESWTDALTVSEEMISKCQIFKFLVNHTAVGFYVLNPPEKRSIELEMLFVIPSFIGKGIGKQLIQHSFEIAFELKATSITLVADPNAFSFYASKGFYEIDRKESAIPGRLLPVMQKDLI